MAAIDIKSVWSLFKDFPVEKQYALYESGGALCANKISSEETESSGSFDHEAFAAFCGEFRGKRVWIAHNHVDADSKPSHPDHLQKTFFESLSRICGFRLEDYLIVSPYGYTSFSENGLMEIREATPINEERATHLFMKPVFSHADAQTRKSEIISELERSGELLSTPDGCFSARAFSGEELIMRGFPHRRRSVFFAKSAGEAGDLERLADIDRALRPMEVYLCRGGELIPCKKSGFF